MQSYAIIGLHFLRFWFVEAPIGMAEYFMSFNVALLKFFSFRLLLSTYFRPWKNEYRDGLIGFSILMGMIFKGATLLFTLALLIVCCLLELTIIVAFILWPIATIWLVFKS